MPVDLSQVSEKTKRVVRHWIKGQKQDLDVYRISLEHLYFNIENGRYADRMIRLRQENPGVEIDPRQDKWKRQIEEMLAGEHRETTSDKAAFERLLQDIREREQLQPGVVLINGGVIDGNRRLAALRRLWKDSKNAARFAYFDAVILPKDTTDEDRWFIEAGIQLGMPERLDYTPINELLKVRQGIQLYETKIEDGSLPSTASPVKLVARALYGRTEADVEEMYQRLRLIDEYLESTGRPEAYDDVGPQSEDFLEATKIISAAENQQLDPIYIAKLKHVLFYLIEKNLMDNKQLRQIYQALGGDPKKKGPRPKRVNMPALDELLKDFPDARQIRHCLAGQTPVVPAKRLTVRPRKSPKQEEKKPALDPSKVQASTERFLRKMETTGKSKPPRTIAEGVKAELEALETSLKEQDIRTALTVDDRAAISESLDSMERSIRTCRKHLKGS
jgi:hypothetical protein